MKDSFCLYTKSYLTSLLLLGCLLMNPQTAAAQVSEAKSNAELYRLITQLEQAGKHSEAAEAYRIIAERDLAEIENLDRAIKNYIEAQKLFGKAGDSLKMYQTITDLGRLYCGSEYYLEAISMFERVEGYAERTLDTVLSARMLQQIGEIYIARNQMQEASKYFERASRLNMMIQDTLLSTINRLTITALTGQKPLFKDLPDSLSIDLTRYDSIRYLSFLPSIHLHVGMYNMHAKKYKLALYYFSQGLRLAGKDTFVKRELYRQQAECYEKMKNYPAALHVMKTLNHFNDSLNNAGKSASIQQMFLKDKDIQRETELLMMERDRNITALKSNIQKVLSYALLVGAVIMLIVSYIIIRSYQQRLNSNQIIADQNEEINRRKINELESNRKIESISSMLQGQEVERERIARDLHDSLGGLLSTVKLHFDAIQAKNPEITNQKEYNKAYNLLDAACSEVRTISNNMQPGALLKMGIVPAIKDLVNRIESEDTPHIEFLHYGPLHDLAIGVTLNIFRIVQELLYNCLKHAHSKEILIQLIRNDEDIEIMVEDDGVGYEPTEVRKGMGTENVAARVNFLKGEISVHSEKGVGTTTTITIPYTKETAEDEVFTQIDPEVFSKDEG
ncbi:MAG TPA: histidine kinase [Saprospiraceae bacterium]|nr:histidine kinase [Saprospiraceae bacterium]